MAENETVLEKYFKKIQKPADDYCKENNINGTDKEFYTRGYHQGVVEGRLMVIKIVKEELQKDEPKIKNKVQEYFTNNPELIKQEKNKEE